MNATPRSQGTGKPVHFCLWSCGVLALEGSEGPSGAAVPYCKRMLRSSRDAAQSLRVSLSNRGTWGGGSKPSKISTVPCYVTLRMVIKPI